MWTKNFCISLEELSRKSTLVLYVTAVTVSFKGSSGTRKGKQERVKLS